MAEIMTTYEIAKALSVDITTVMKWIDQGKLEAYRTPGRHRRVKKIDLLAFLRDYKMPVPETLRRRQRLILIVDDELGIRRFIQRALKRIGGNTQIEEASDGFVAGKKMATLKPDLVVLDVNLPGISGADLCRDVKHDTDLRSIRILAISGDASLANRQKLLDAGAEIFMGKPLEISELVQNVIKLLELEGKPAEKI